MGCDIHIYAEHRLTRDHPWTAVGQPVESRYRLSSPIQYEARSYLLFAALADVRNRHGVTPIAAARGLPEDITDKVAVVAHEWGRDGHTHTHLTLAELALWEGWMQRFDLSMWVGEGTGPTRMSDDRLFRLTETANDLGRLPNLSPMAWNLATCTGSSEPDRWRNLTFQARLDRNVGEEWWRYMADLHRLGLGRDPNDTRVVLWFDN